MARESFNKIERRERKRQRAEKKVLRTTAKRDARKANSEQPGTTETDASNLTVPDC